MIEAQYTREDWFDNMRNTLYEYSKDVRPSMPLTIRRVQNYTSPKDGEGKVTGYCSELVCCGVVMGISHIALESSAQWLLSSWIREMDKALAKYENGQISDKPTAPQNADEYARAILSSTIYKEKHQDTATT